MAYIKPIPRDGIYFTRDLTEQNFDNGEVLLGYYFRASKLSKPPQFPVTNFQGMINFLQDRYPTYIEALGETLKSVEIGKMIEVMNEVAKKGYLDYPRPAYFSNEILRRTGYNIVTQSVKAVGIAIEETASVIVNASKIAWVLAVIGVGIYAYVNFESVKGLFKK